MNNLEVFFDKRHKFSQRNTDCGDCDCACAQTIFDETIKKPIDYNKYYECADFISLPISKEHFVLVGGRNESVITVVNSQSQELISALKTPFKIIDLHQKKYGDIPEKDFLDAIANFLETGLLDEVGTKFEANKPSLMTVWMHVTNSCNLDCPYCFVNKSNEKMSFDVAKLSIEKIFDAAIKNCFSAIKIKFAGGEPTLSLDFVVKVYEYAKKLANETGINVSCILLTNGTLVNKKLIDFLNKSSSEIMISLDGMGIHHDVHRKNLSGKGSFIRIKKNISDLMLAGIKPYVSITLSHENIDGLPLVIDYLLDLELTFTINLFRNNPFSNKIQPVHMNSEYIINILKSTYEVIRKKMPKTYVSGSVLDLTNLTFAHSKPCGVGESYVVIDHKGLVYKCHMDMEKPITSIFDKKDLIKSISGDPSGVENLHVFQKKVCNECEWRLWCAGGCPLNTFYVYEKYDVSSPNCMIYKSLLPEVLKLEGQRILSLYQKSFVVQEQ